MMIKPYSPTALQPYSPTVLQPYSATALQPYSRALQPYSPTVTIRNEVFIHTVTTTGSVNEALKYSSALNRDIVYENIEWCSVEWCRVVW